MSEPKRVAFSYTDATVVDDDETALVPAQRHAPRALTYPDVPLVYPANRPRYCSGCCSYQAFLWKRDGDASMFKPRQALPGQANCEACAGKERERRARGDTK